MKNELTEAGHMIVCNKKKRALMRALAVKYSVTSQVLGLHNLGFAEAVSLLIIQESTLDVKWREKSGHL